MELNTGQSPRMDWEARDLATAFDRFKEHTTFMFGGPLEKKSEAVKCHYMMLWLGDKGREIYSTWDLSENDKKKLATYYRRFEEYCRPKTNTIYNRFRFQSRTQKDGETFEQFVTELKVLIRDCAYPAAIVDDLIRDHIVFGLKSNEIREKLIREGSGLKLDKCIDIVRTHEISQTRSRDMDNQTVVDAIRRHGVRRRQTTRATGSKPHETYGNCGQMHEKGNCPAFGQKCHHCGKLSHYSKVCRITLKDKQNLKSVNEKKTDACELEMSVNQGESKKTTSLYNINRKIFVGNISYRVKSRKLSRFFSKFGRVSDCYIAKDHIKGWSRGIGFVTFEEESGMRKALDAEDRELLLDDRQMRVKPAELSAKTIYLLSDDEDDDDGDDDRKDQGADTCCHTKEVPTSSVTMETMSRNKTSEPQSEGPCLIHNLFEEVLVKIFTYLSWRQRIGIERVCWRWKHAVQKTWTYQKMLHFQQVFKGFDGLTDARLSCVLSRCGSYLQSLDLSASPRLVTDFAMDIIAKQCAQLQELDVTAVKVTDRSMKNLTAQCTQLQKVRLNKCMHIADKGIGWLLEACHGLEHLDLSEVPLVTGQCFKSSGQPKETLTTVILTNCHKFEDRGVSHLCRLCPNLEHLNLANCHSLTSQAMLTLGQALKNLKNLNVSGVKYETSSLAAIRHFHHLETLNVSFSRQVQDSTIKSVVEGCSKLRDVDISGCNSLTDDGILELCKLAHLTAVNISYISRISTSSVMQLAQGGKLQKFVARATSFTTDEVVLTLAAACPSLELVDVSGCFQVTSRCLDGFRCTQGLSNSPTELVLGGTSVDLTGPDADWFSSFQQSSVKISMHNPSLQELRADRDLILPNYEEESWSDDGYVHPPHPPLAEFVPEHVEPFNDWGGDDYGDDFDDDFDDYLDNDDPLAAERWDMS